MKRIISLFSVCAILLQGATYSLFAADAVADVDHLEVAATASAKVGESLDVTVKAVAKDGSVVPGYTGTIFFMVDNDTRATIPFADGYTFTAADQGKKTFSKGLSFTKAGTFKVTVSDVDKPKIEGNVKITVTSADSTPTGTGSELVTITSPDNGSAIGGKDLSITGVTKKNSKVQLFLNGAKALESQTDDKGAFLFQVKDVTQIENVFTVKVLDGTDKMIGESEKINVKVGSEGPVFKSLVFSGGTNVIASAPLSATVTADAGLKEVTITIGNDTQVLKETSAGAYEGSITAPSTSGSGVVDVSLKNDLGKTTLKKAAATLTVLEAPKASFENIKVETAGKKVTFTFGVKNESADIAKFEFAYSTGTGPEQKSLTYEKAKLKNATGGTYTWYIDNLDIAKYTFAIAGAWADGKTLSGVVSEPVEVDLSLGSAGKCMIANVSGMKVETKNDVSVLSWDAIGEATSYKVYKKDKDGKFVFIEETKSPTYTIHLAAGPVKFEEFSIKAVCADKTESVEYAPSTRVQTGPAELFLLILVAVGLGYAVVRKQRRA